MSKFIITPYEILEDKRLTLMQIRVLLGLLSFSGKNTNMVWPHRSKLVEIIGYSESNVSRVTTQLVDMGWLKKIGNGGRNRPAIYEITVPETMTGSVTVLKPETMTGSVTVLKPETMTDSVTVTEQNTKQLPNRTLNGDRLGHPHRTNQELTKKSKESVGTHAHKKPTLQEVENYCKHERKNNLNPNSFFDYYESNGWMVGKNKMKDWRATVRRWEVTQAEKTKTVKYRLTTEDIYADF